MLAHDRGQWRDFVCTAMNIRVSYTNGIFLDRPSKYKLLKAIVNRGIGWLVGWYLNVETPVQGEGKGKCISVITDPMEHSCS